MGARIPGEAIACGFMLLFNVMLVVLFFKELMLTTFDADLARSLGFRPRLVHYALMALTSATVVTSFEVVGSILVIGMLVIPPSTAFFITRRLCPMIVISVLVAVSASVLGARGSECFTWTADGNVRFACDGKCENLRSDCGCGCVSVSDRRAIRNGTRPNSGSIEA